MRVSSPSMRRHARSGRGSPVGARRCTASSPRRARRRSRSCGQGRCCCGRASNRSRVAGTNGGSARASRRTATTGFGMVVRSRRLRVTSNSSSGARSAASRPTSTSVWPCSCSSRSTKRCTPPSRIDSAVHRSPTRRRSGNSSAGWASTSCPSSMRASKWSGGAYHASGSSACPCRRSRWSSRGRPKRRCRLSRGSARSARRSRMPIRCRRSPASPGKRARRTGTRSSRADIASGCITARPSRRPANTCAARGVGASAIRWRKPSIPSSSRRRASIRGHGPSRRKLARTSSTRQPGHCALTSELCR